MNTRELLNGNITPTEAVGHSNTKLYIVFWSDFARGRVRYQPFHFPCRDLNLLKSLFNASEVSP